MPEKPKRPKYLFQIGKSRNGKWFWRIQHANGHKLSSAQMYSTRAKAIQTAYNMFKSFKVGHAALDKESQRLIKTRT